MSDQRTDYGNKAGENSHDKVLSKGSLAMTKAGGSGGENSGPTGSSRSYPKGGGSGLKLEKPMACKPTDWVVGGV